MQDNAVRKTQSNSLTSYEQRQQNLHTLKQRTKTHYSKPQHRLIGHTFYDAMCDIFPHFRVFCFFVAHLMICFGLAEILTLWAQTSPNHVTGWMMLSFFLWSLDAIIAIFFPIMWLVLRMWVKNQ